MFAFELTLDVAMEFYKRKAALNAITEEQCWHILMQMAQEGLIAKVEATTETKEQYIKRLSKSRNVLHIKGKKNARNKKKSEADGGEAGTLGN